MVGSIMRRLIQLLVTLAIAGVCLSCEAKERREGAGAPNITVERMAAPFTAGWEADYLLEIDLNSMRIVNTFKTLPHNLDTTIEARVITVLATREPSQELETPPPIAAGDNITFIRRDSFGESENGHELFDKLKTSSTAKTYLALRVADFSGDLVVTNNGSVQGDARVTNVGLILQNTFQVTKGGKLKFLDDSGNEIATPSSLRQEINDMQLNPDPALSDADALLRGVAEVTKAPGQFDASSRIYAAQDRRELARQATSSIPKMMNWVDVPAVRRQLMEENDPPVWFDPSPPAEITNSLLRRQVLLRFGPKAYVANANMYLWTNTGRALRHTIIEGCTQTYAFTTPEAWHVSVIYLTDELPKVDKFVEPTFVELTKNPIPMEVWARGDVTLIDIRLKNEQAPVKAGSAFTASISTLTAAEAEAICSTKGTPGPEPKDDVANGGAQ